MLILNSKTKRKLVNYYLKIADYSNKDDIFIARNSLIASSTSIGVGTRINGPIIIKGLGKVSLGNYCAIGDNVRIITSNHDVNYLNIQYALQKKISGRIFPSAVGDIIIENNVWIGDSTIILPGAKIGNCAIIGAGSIVTKHVPGYCIYAGNPAKSIKKRFSEEVIELLEKISWWDWPVDKLIKHKELFEKNIITEEKDILHKLRELSASHDELGEEAARPQAAAS